MNGTATQQKKSRSYSKSGYYGLKRTTRGLDTSRLDRRYKAFRVLSEWRTNLIADLGGQDAISTQQAALIDLCVKSKLLLDAVDGWLLAQPSLVNARKKALLPVVRERQTLADGLSRYLAQLGLSRRPKTVSLQELLEQGESEEGPPESDPSGKLVRDNEVS